MARSRLFDWLMRSLQTAFMADRDGLSTQDALSERSRAEEASRLSRRSVLGGLAGVGAAVAAGTIGATMKTAQAAPQAPSQPRIAIIGAGLSGLACADKLRTRGIAAIMYEANPSRVGGRCHSLRSFPGQTAEYGGELIDTSHKAMLAYAQEFNLAKEDLTKQPGDPAYFVGGVHYTEAQVIDELRVLIGRMRADTARISKAPSLAAHTVDDEYFDNLSLAEYLDTRANDLPLVHAVIKAAYIGEYGRELDEQSSLNFLLYTAGNRRSKFEPFGSSDERYHLVNGNDQIATGIRDRLTGPLNMGAFVERLRKTASGKIAIKLAGSSQEDLVDAAVLAIPFSVLRTIQLDPSLSLSADKLRAINQIGYGKNAKMMVAFDSRPWAAQGKTGSSYADLAKIQNSWETNYTQATSSRGIITNFTGGDLAESLQLGPQSAQVTQAQTDAFLDDLNLIFPGAKAAARKSGNDYVVETAHWFTNPLSLGSYTCYGPGQFTTICGVEGESADNLFFAGESANSFYMYQGFMEGAVLAGQDAAYQVLHALKTGQI